ncbi:hypothetical protein MTR_0292s0020 [Medicago truncatula]|uniref:Uncharacterized protein n=1 Tax=Medicago truncatula TaxID=3880 RepID=A0A072TGQ0_MEDTR|nr:hypothetical protein MTR_0292s0020 [Medicago truncatula]
MDDNSSTMILTRQCNFDFLIMHVVPIQGIKPPTYLSINTLPGHQALNLLSKGSRASSPQRVEQRLQGIKSPT